MAVARRPFYFCEPGTGTTGSTCCVALFNANNSVEQKAKPLSLLFIPKATTNLEPIMANDLLYQIALTLIPNIGSVQSQNAPGTFWRRGKRIQGQSKKLEAIEQMGSVRAGSIKTFEDFATAEKKLNLLPGTRSIRFLLLIKLSATFAQLFRCTGIVVLPR